MSYSACDFMDDVCAALVEAGMATREAFEECGEDSGAVASIAIAAIHAAAPCAGVELYREPPG